jgi:hypothetical protein
MKMSDIKLPMMKADTKGTATDAKTNISASALYKYLGWTSSRRTGTNAIGGVLKNGVPLLMYLDIFKNFFANTQENKFYILKGAGNVKLNFAKTYNNENNGIYVIGKDQNSVHITNTTTITAGVVTTNYRAFWNSIKVTIMESDGGLYYKTLAQLTTNAAPATITLNNVNANQYATILQFFTTKETANFIKTELGQHDLKVLDQIRDVVLHKKGNETLILAGSELNETNNGSAELVSFFNDIINSQANKLGGMLLKTYDSDIFNNWIKTDWIDGAGGITEITSIDCFFFIPSVF